MTSSVAAPADLSALDRVDLEALVAAQQKESLTRDAALVAHQEKLLSRDNEFEHLKPGMFSIFMLPPLRMGWESEISRTTW